MHGYFLRKWFNIPTRNTGKINFFSVKSLTSKGTTPFIKALEEIKTKYDTRGFKITDYHGENKFNIKIL